MQPQQIATFLFQELDVELDRLVPGDYLSFRDENGEDVMLDMNKIESMEPIEKESRRVLIVTNEEFLCYEGTVNYTVDFGCVKAMHIKVA